MIIRNEYDDTVFFSLSSYYYKFSNTEKIMEKNNELYQRKKKSIQEKKNYISEEKKPKLIK